MAALPAASRDQSDESFLFCFIFAKCFYTSVSFLRYINCNRGFLEHQRRKLHKSGSRTYNCNYPGFMHAFSRWKWSCHSNSWKTRWKITEKKKTGLGIAVFLQQTISMKFLHRFPVLLRRVKCCWEVRKIYWLRFSNPPAFLSLQFARFRLK